MAGGSPHPVPARRRADPRREALAAGRCRRPAALARGERALDGAAARTAPGGRRRGCRSPLARQCVRGPPGPPAGRRCAQPRAQPRALGGRRPGDAAPQRRHAGARRRSGKSRSAVAVPGPTRVRERRRAPRLGARSRGLGGARARRGAERRRAAGRGRRRGARRGSRRLAASAPGGRLCRRRRRAGARFLSRGRHVAHPGRLARPSHRRRNRRRGPPGARRPRRGLSLRQGPGNLRGERPHRGRHP